MNLIINRKENKMNLTDLKHIINFKISTSYFKINNLHNQIALHENIIELLNKGIVSKEAQNILEKKYNYKIDNHNLEPAIATLKSDLFILKEQIKIENIRYEKLKMIKNSLKYNQIIKLDLIDYIKDILLEENISNTDLINIIERIKIHNRNCQPKDAISSPDLFLIINMINQGYEKIKIKDNANKDKLMQVAIKTISLIDSNSLTEAKNNLNIEDIYNSNDSKYIYSLVLKHYQDEIINLINILKEKDFYFNITILNDIKEDYKLLYQKYMFVRNLLDNIKNDIYEEEEIEIEDIPSSDKKLYYSSNSEEPSKCYFIKDLENIREESLTAILHLINDFKEGKTNKLKKLTNEKKSFLELKEDQIRIVLKPLGNNCYSIMGVFIKKSENDRITYENILKRPIATLDDNYSLNVEAYYQEYIKNNARSGTR